MGLLDNVTQQQYYSDQYLKHGDYQFIDLYDVIDNFMATYVGPDKILSKTGGKQKKKPIHKGLDQIKHILRLYKYPEKDLKKIFK